MGMRAQPSIQTLQFDSESILLVKELLMEALLFPNNHW
jgi:hypothetical protein